MKIVVLNGSARKGNTLTAINAFIEGVQAKGHEIDLINTDGLNVSPCKGCGACQCYKGCVAKDDSNAIVDRIVSGDMIVFASPVYWWGITAQLKTVIDKCYCKGANLQQKKIGVIIVGGASTDDPQYELIGTQFQSMAKFLNWDVKFCKAYSATGTDDLAGNAEAMAELKGLCTE